MGNKVRKKVLLSVNCYENDSDDILCGGPRYLGFDFTVFSEDVEFALETIRQRHPILHQWQRKSTSRVWTRKQIEAEVEKELG